MNRCSRGWGWGLWVGWVLGGTPQLAHAQSRWGAGPGSGLPAVQCPADLAIERGKRSLDTRPPAPIPQAQWTQKKWVREDAKPIDDSFALSADKAVDQILAVEATSPTLVPAGFRVALAAAPRDPDLRLRMAQCEVNTAQTKRRGEEDALMAILLGTPKLALAEKLSGQAQQRRRLSLPQGDTKCPKSAGTYDAKNHECLTDDAKQFLFISEREASLEDLLSRGLFGLRPKVTAHDIANFQNTLHRCSGQWCLTVVMSDGAVVHRDLRNGGSQGVSYQNTAAQKRSKPCHDHTGANSLEECKQNCDVGGAPNKVDCHSKCAAWCEPHE